MHKGVQRCKMPNGEHKKGQFKYFFRTLNKDGFGFNFISWVGDLGWEKWKFCLPQQMAEKQ